MIICDYELGEVKKRELTADEKKQVCDYVVARWNAWSKPVESLQDNTRIIRDRATPAICDIKQPERKQDWHSKIKLNRMYEFYNKLYGILYETFYDKISSYLKLGKERHDEVYNNALDQENKKTLLVSIKDMLDTGEVVASSEYKTIYKKEVLPIEEIGTVDPRSIISVRENSFVVRQEVGRRLNFVRIDPCNFVYDPLITPCTDDFYECDKIVKIWKTRREILSNKSYELDEKAFKEQFAQQTTPNMESQDEETISTVYRYNQIEVLTMFGTFYIDGKAYENYVAVVIGREFLAYFAPKGIYTPDIYYYPFHARGNGSRGVSPLFYIADLCKAEEEAFNDTRDAVKLQLNPTRFAPTGFFEEPVVKQEPGKVITYRLGMQDPTAIIKENIDAQPALQSFQETTKQLEKEIAGIDNGQLSVKSEALTEEEVKRIAVSESLIPNMIISGIMLNIVSRYLKDCVQMTEGQELDGNIVKTAWEYANEQLQMQNIVALMEKVGMADPTMPKIQDTAARALQAMGVKPEDYLNDGRTQQIIQNFAGLSDDVLQQLAQMGQQLQVQENNITKAQKMMGNIQDDEYRKVLRKSWEETGMMPESVIVPNGDSTMEVPVTRVTPSTQTKNRTSTTAN
ncbi:MAG: hypothetical protein IIZ94_06700 [Prevotella sp.]|nr:hypothetical protein [Prevotella sp.]